MTLDLPALPYARDALEPHLSAESFSFHYDRHHQNYVTQLHKLIQGTPFQDLSLERLVREGKGAIFNNAAQIWNHNFFWNSMAPEGGGSPPDGPLLRSIEAQFGSFASFREAFIQKAVGNFGAGWTWLVRRRTGEVGLVNTSNAETPLVSAHRPLLTIDLWEHAYYIDYRHARQRWVESYLDHLANWRFAGQQFDA